jgi:hypothetical protein
MRYIVTLKNGIALLFLAVGGFLLKETYRERTVFFFSPDELGPMTYPRYLLWGWVALSALYLIIPRKPFDGKQVIQSLPILIAATAAIGAYIALFKYCGLFVATFLFLLLFFLILGYRHPAKIISIAGITAVISWLIFEKLLAIPMPTSILQTLFG